VIGPDLKTSFGGRTVKSGDSVTAEIGQIDTPNGRSFSPCPQCKARLFRPAVKDNRCSGRIFAADATEVASRRAWRADASAPKTAERGLGAAVKPADAPSATISNSVAALFIPCINPVYQVGADLR
jgi:hypothetical protein